MRQKSKNWGHVTVGFLRKIDLTKLKLEHEHETRLHVESDESVELRLSLTVFTLLCVKVLIS